MNFKIDNRFFLFLFLALSVVACKEDDPVDPHDHDHDEELITTVELTFTKDGNSLVYTWKDVDGEGGNEPVIENIALEANATYQLTTRVLNESEDPAEDITEEVAEENLEHLFVYTVDGANMEVTITDTDSAGDPLGLTADVVMGEASSGSFRVMLKHEPDKAASDPASTGETDIEVDFAINIE